MTANVIAFPIDAVAQEHGTLHGGSPSGSQVRSSTRDRRCWPLFERLAAESASVEAFDIAIAAFLKERERSGPKHPGRPALDRLARLYIRHFRREIVSQHRFFEVARQALMASAGCGRMIRRPFIHMDV